MKKIIVIILALLFILSIFVYYSKNNTFIEGAIFNCKNKPILDQNIFVGIFKDLEAIKNFTPLSYSILKNNNRYKINTGSLGLNNFFLIAYTSPYETLVPPSSTSLINKWETSVTSLNVYKNLYLCNSSNNAHDITNNLISRDKAPSNENDRVLDDIETDTEQELNDEDTELYNYKINASLDETYFKQLCLEDDSLVAIAEVYDSSLNNFYPTKKSKYSIKTKNPLDRVLLYCNEYNFELNFSSNKVELYPYITVRVLSSDSKKIIAYGLAEDTNGVPISLLSIKKNNEPIVIKLKNNLNPNFGELIINVGEKKILLLKLKI